MTERVKFEKTSHDTSVISQVTSVSTVTSKKRFVHQFYQVSQTNISWKK